MKTLIRSSFTFILLLLTISAFSQKKEGSAIICGRIIFKGDSVFNLKPNTIILQKEWPITFQQFEQEEIDTSNFSFKIFIDLNQLTYGKINVNFFQEIDSNAIARYGPWVQGDAPDGFFGSDYAGRILFSGLEFVLEPGDSLNIVINYDKLDQYGRASAIFSGKGAANNNFLRFGDRNEYYSKSFRMPLDEGLSYEDLIMKNKLKDLLEAKDSISYTYFSLLKTDILYENLNKKHALIRASLYGPDIEIDEKRALARKYYSYLDTLTLRSECLNSREFRNFLNFYLEYLNRTITGKDIPFDQNEKSYWLAHAVFDEEILKAFLYEELAYQMERSFFLNTKAFQYVEFIKRYPETPESYRLTKIYKKHFPVSNGQFAPDLKLVDSTGKKKDLSDLRGKVLIISSGQALLSVSRYPQKIERIESLRKRFGDDLVMISLLRHQKPGPLYNYIDYYINEDQNSQNPFTYKFLSGPLDYNFIIGKNGIIKNCVYDLYIPEETIYELVSEKYTILTRLKNTAERHIIGIVVFLSVLISFILVLLLISKLRQRRQDLIKRQLNSELKAIRSQLNPHFLFNSLNSIQNFINKSDSKTANLHLSKFSLLMRRIIELSETESTTLKEELDFNKTYIELEQLRYGFKCNFDIANSVDQFNTEIPSMIIQPFIENAIVHCMADLGVKGELSIFVKEKDKDKILIEITDNGKGFLADTEKGFGLKSSRERIDLLNSQSKDKIELYIESRAANQAIKGTTIRMIIPKKY